MRTRRAGPHILGDRGSGPHISGPHNLYLSTCPHNYICSEENYYKVNFNNLYLRTDSYNKNLHSYESRVCANCGVVYQFPQVTKESIADYYKKNMRKTKFPIYFDKENFIDAIPSPS